MAAAAEVRAQTPVRAVDATALDETEAQGLLGLESGRLRSPSDQRTLLFWFCSFFSEM